jgi:hypothetical protein
MPRKKPAARYTAKQLAAKRKRGESRSDWKRAAAMTREGNQGGHRLRSRRGGHDDQLE